MASCKGGRFHFLKHSKLQPANRALKNKISTPKLIKHSAHSSLLVRITTRGGCLTVARSIKRMQRQLFATVPVLDGSAAEWSFRSEKSFFENDAGTGSRGRHIVAAEREVVAFPARYGLLPLATAFTGYSVKAMKRNIEHGDWQEGTLWSAPQDNRPNGISKMG
jgi:hypothetical protein